MTTTSNMTLVLPTLNGDPGVWDTLINAALERVDLHNHTTGYGVQVPSAGIGINADLTFAGYAATNLKATRYSSQSASPGARSVYFKTDDLYIADGNNVEIRVTSGGQLNMSLVGGIAGDYAAVSASLYYDDTAQTYRFLEAAPAPNSWSRVACGDLDLYEHASGIANRVRLSSPAALAASYALTFPGALPGSTLLQQVSAAGVISWSNTIANAVSMSSTLGVTGLITATAGLTAAANQHVTVSGTGEFKHGSLPMNVSPYAGQDAGTTTPGVGYVISTANGIRYMPVLGLKAGDRVTDAQYSIYGDGAVDITFELVHYTGTNVRTVLGTATKNNEAAAWTTYSLAVTDTTLATNDQLVFEWTYNAANARLGGCSVAFTRP